MRRTGRRDPEGARILAIVGLVFLAVGSALLTLFGWGVPTDWRIDRNQLVVPCVVETSEMDPTRRVGRRPVQRIAYRYSVGGRTYRDELVTVDAELVAALTPGAQGRLEVNASAPEESRLAGRRLARFGPWGLLLGVVPMLGVALLLGARHLRLRG